MQNVKNSIQTLLESSALIRAGLSGTLLGVGFVAPWLWPLGFIALVPLLSVLYNSSLSTGRAFWLGTVTGTITSLYVVSWFWSTLPLDWIGIESMVVSTAIISVTWLSVSLMLGLGVGLAMAVFCRLQSQSNFDGLLFASLWVLGEVLGAFFFAVHTYGPGVLWGAHFSISTAGYLLAHNFGFVQYAALGGVFVLSFILAWVNFFWFSQVVSQRDRIGYRSSLVLAGLILCWMFGHGLYYLQTVQSNQTEPTLTIAAVYTDTPAVLTLDALEQQRRLDAIASVLAKLEPAVDVVVLPEGASFLSNLRVLTDSGLGRAMAEVLPDKKFLIIDSTTAPDADQNLRARLEYFDTTQQSLSALAYKQFLMPYGEYMPHFYYVVAQLLGQGKALADLKDTRAMQPGHESVLVPVNGVSLVTLFCSDLISPFLFQQAAKSGAEVLINVSAYSWMHGSPVTYQQMRAMSRVRAVESGRPYVQASNMAPAFAFDKHGKLVAESPRGTGAMMMEVTPSSGATVYGLAGSWVLMLPILLVLGAGWRRLRYK